MAAVAIALSALWSSPATATAPTPYGKNLVKDPGAEAGAASPDGNAPVAIPAWTREYGDFVVVAYGTAGGFPSRAEGRRIHGGHQFFSAGPYNTEFGTCDQVRQKISIKGRNAAIDGGHVLLKLKIRLGTYDSQTDQANASVIQLDSLGGLIPSAPTALVSATQTQQHLRSKSAAVVLTAGTRAVQIIFDVSDPAGYCDGYFDNASVVLSRI